MIRVKNLTKKYDTDHTVLSGIDFEVKHGEFIAILGASGSGKTTLFRCLTLQEKWDAGEFMYDDNDVLSMNLWEKYKFRKEWAYLSDVTDLNLNKTAVKNVLRGRIYQTALWRTLFGKAEQVEHFKAMDYLKKVGLLDKGQQKVETLSGGEKQRVALTKALVQGAKVIVADDPIKGLDPTSAADVLAGLNNVREKDRTTIFCSLQQVELAEKHATRIWGLAEGKLVLDITGRRLTQREKNLIFT
jgi:phosphonate transport system ATP-binding protein